MISSLQGNKLVDAIKRHCAHLAAYLYGCLVVRLDVIVHFMRDERPSLMICENKSNPLLFVLIKKHVGPSNGFTYHIRKQKKIWVFFFFPLFNMRHHETLKRRNRYSSRNADDARFSDQVCKFNFNRWPLRVSFHLGSVEWFSVHYPIPSGLEPAIGFVVPEFCRCKITTENKHVRCLWASPMGSALVEISPKRHNNPLPCR